MSEEVNIRKRHDWEAIKHFPTSTSELDFNNLNRVNESVFQSYQILEAVEQMLERGDSSETVLKFIEYCRS